MLREYLKNIVTHSMVCSSPCSCCRNSQRANLCHTQCEDVWISNLCYIRLPFLWSILSVNSMFIFFFSVNGNIHFSFNYYNWSLLVCYHSLNVDFFITFWEPSLRIQQHPRSGRVDTSWQILSYHSLSIVLPCCWPLQWEWTWQWKMWTDLADYNRWSSGPKG